MILDDGYRRNQVEDASSILRSAQSVNRKKREVGQLAQILHQQNYWAAHL